ncbi:hypothetical protein SAMN05421504_109239 [Amycolatopsis xylanica]|uniref:Lipoprotein n=1 Tax=Amycolatopsis xylanica TaxID=589385 RepID=A0A1H3QCA9_9PSEU|nr:hypothetical protein [Amycolatopsis xylanica]SDZ10910.1 hypothetical protein SAMN05421504_109239 [Amycolatopsis xylanica]
MGKLWFGAAAVLLVAGCSSTPEAPKVFGPTAYGKLTLGMTAEAALATGELAKEPTSRLDGCTDYSLTGGPAPDPARMAAQDAAEKDLAEKDKIYEEAAAKNGHSAAESAAVAKAAADSAMAAVPRAEQREIRDKAMGVSGGVSIGKSGLVTLAAPAGAKTPEGVAQGSTVDELKKAYGARVTEKDGEFSAPIPEKDGFVYRFLTSGGKVTGVFVTTPKIKCS